MPSLSARPSAVSLSADGVVTVTVVPAKHRLEGRLRIVRASHVHQRVVGKRALSPVGAWGKAADAAGHHVVGRSCARQDPRRFDRRLGKRPQRLRDGASDRLRHREEGRHPRLRHDRDQDDPRRAGLLPRDRRRGDRQAALPAEPGRPPGGRPGVVGVPDRAAVQPDQRVPVELPEHGRAADLLLDRDGRLHERRLGQSRQRRSTRSASPRSSNGTSRWTSWDVQGTPQSTVGNNVDEALAMERRRPVVQQPGQPAADQRDARLHGSELPVHEPVVQHRV